MGPDSPGYLLGVDFGTSNTAAGHAKENGDATQALPLTHSGNLMPSSVFIASPEQIDVGDVALNKAALDPSGFVAAPKRVLTIGQSTFHIDRFDIPAAEIVAAILRTVLSRAQARHSGRLPSGLVLTHPEGWAPQQVRILTDAADAVGFPASAVHTVSEPQAAAHYYSRSTPLRPGSRIAVFDFGGGTLDVAVLSADPDGAFHVVAARGDNALGGRNFDATLRRWVDGQLAEHRPDLLAQLDAASMMDARTVDQSIRQAKELLSETPSAGIDLRFAGQHERLSITRTEFETLIGPEVARAVSLARSTFDAAGIQDPSALEAIYLTGGSSRIPLVQREVQALGPVATLDDPKTVVAQGALIAAARRPARESGRPTDRITMPEVRAPYTSPAATDRIPQPPQPLPANSGWQSPTTPTAALYQQPTTPYQGPPQQPTYQPTAAQSGPYGPPPGAIPPGGGYQPGLVGTPWGQPPRRNRTPMVIGLVTAAVLVLGAVIGLAVANSGGHHTTNAVATSTVAAASSTVPPDDTSTDSMPSSGGTDSQDDAQSAAVGDCVQVSGSDSAPAVHRLDCSDPKANARVAIKYGNSTTQCPSHDYQSVWSSGENFRTCYELNASNGDCFKDDGDKNSIKVDCTDPTAKYRVELHTGTASISVCGNGTTADNAYVFPVPSPVTLCLRPPNS